MTEEVRCTRPQHSSGRPATYGFELDPYEDEEPIVVKYCAPCVAFAITQDYFSRNEVSTLHKL